MGSLVWVFRIVSFIYSLYKTGGIGRFAGPPVLLIIPFFKDSSGAALQIFDEIFAVF